VSDDEPKEQSPKPVIKPSDSNKKENQIIPPPEPPTPNKSRIILSKDEDTETKLVEQP
jgi:hypothetical protein